MVKLRSAATESIVAVSELGRHGREHRAHPVLGLQQPQGLLAKLELLESQSRVPRQNLISLCPLVKLGFLGPEQTAGNSAGIPRPVGEAQHVSEVQCQGTHGVSR